MISESARVSTRFGALMPDRLDTWLGASRLIHLALDAVQEASVGGGRDATDGASLKPRTLLTLLTYCYAAGQYDSREIAWGTKNDAPLRYLCCGQEPEGCEIRRFRRRHCRELRQTLVHLFQAAIKERRGETMEADGGRRFAVIERKLASEAEERIRRAIFLDSMAMDD